MYTEPNSLSPVGSLIGKAHLPIPESLTRLRKEPRKNYDVLDASAATSWSYTAMIKNQALSHPEIELRPSFFRSSNGAGQTRTFLDLLEVYPDYVNWKENLDHLSLLNHFRV